MSLGSLHEILKLIRSGDAILLDVREREEWELEHLQGAFFFPLSLLGEGQIPSELPECKPIYTYCRMGQRSQVAVPYLRNMNVPVHALTHSFLELKAAGF